MNVIITDAPKTSRFGLVRAILEEQEAGSSGHCCEWLYDHRDPQLIRSVWHPRLDLRVTFIA